MDLSLGGGVIEEIGVYLNLPILATKLGEKGININIYNNNQNNITFKKMGALSL